MKQEELQAMGDNERILLATIDQLRVMNEKLAAEKQAAWMAGYEAAIKAAQKLCEGE